MANVDAKLRQAVLAEDAAPVLAKNRFVGAMVMQAGRDAEEARWLFAAADQHPWILAVTPWVDLSKGALPSHSKMRAVRADAAGPAAEHLAGRGLVLDWMTDLAPLPDLPADLAVVLDWTTTAEPETWAPVIEAWASRPGTYLKCARLLTDGLRQGWAPARLHAPLRHAMAVFGYDRVLFGSAWPLSLPRHSWKEVLAYFTQSHGALPPGERWKLIGLNAARVYGLATPDQLAASEAAE
jgi:L-fuconolactonase